MEKRFCYILCSSFSDITLKIKARSNQANKSKMIHNNQSCKDKAGSVHTTECPWYNISIPTREEMSKRRLVGGARVHPPPLLAVFQQLHRILGEYALPISQLAKRTNPYNGLGPKRRAAPSCFLSLSLYIMFYQESQVSTTLEPFCLESSCFSVGVLRNHNKKAVSPFIQGRI